MESNVKVCYEQLMVKQQDYIDLIISVIRIQVEKFSCFFMLVQKVCLKVDIFKGQVVSLKGKIIVGQVENIYLVDLEQVYMVCIDSGVEIFFIDV